MPSGRTLSLRAGNGPTDVVAFGHAIWATLDLDDAVARAFRMSGRPDWPPAG
jgi:hypothetical protein